MNFTQNDGGLGAKACHTRVHRQKVQGGVCRKRGHEVILPVAYKVVDPPK